MGAKATQKRCVDLRYGDDGHLETDRKNQDVEAETHFSFENRLEPESLQAMRTS